MTTLTSQQQRDILVRLGINLAAVKQDSVAITTTDDGSCVITFTYMGRIVDPQLIADLL